MLRAGCTDPIDHAMGRLLDLLPGHDGMSGGGDDDDDVSRSLTTADYSECPPPPHL